MLQRKNGLVRRSNRSHVTNSPVSFGVSIRPHFASLPVSFCVSRKSVEVRTFFTVLEARHDSETGLVSRIASPLLCQLSLTDLKYIAVRHRSRTGNLA